MTEILYATLGQISLITVLHEHDFLLMGTNSQFVQCKTCDAVYCILCGKKIATVITSTDHGVGKCTRSDTPRALKYHSTRINSFDQSDLHQDKKPN